MTDVAKRTAERLAEAISGMEATTPEGQMYVVTEIIRQEFDAETARLRAIEEAAQTFQRCQQEHEQKKTNGTLILVLAAERVLFAALAPQGADR